MVLNKHVAHEAKSCTSLTRYYEYSRRNYAYVKK